MWKQIFRTCFKSINDNDLIWFQYRIPYRILGVNDLSKIKRHPDGMCSLCKENRETILHLFVQCREVKIFWRNLRLRIQYALDLDFDFRPSSLIFDMLNFNSSKTNLNVIYLTAKRHLFEASRTIQNLNSHSFFKKLKQIYLDQEYVAKLQFNYNAFSKSWLKLSLLFIN